MRGIGVHVCESCGKVHDTIGAYQACCDPTPTTSAERGIDPDELERELESGAAILHGDESTCVAPSAERVAALEAVAEAAQGVVIAPHTHEGMNGATCVNRLAAALAYLAALDEHA